MSVPSDRHLPCDIDTERAVLGAVLIHPGDWSVVAEVLRAEDFFRAAHQRIFEAMMALMEAGRPLDPFALKQALGRDLEDVGGMAYLAALTDGVPVRAQVAEYAAIVREKARLRAVIAAAQVLERAAYDEDEPAASLLDGGVSNLMRIADVSSARTVRARPAVAKYLEDLDQSDKLGVLPTGLTDFDALVGGFQRGDYAVVAARPSVGKSSLMLGVADTMARQFHEPTAVVSLEMSLHALAAQLLSWRSYVPTDTMRRKVASVVEYTRVSDAYGSMTDYPLFLVDGARTLTQVAAIARRLHETEGVNCLFIDYLQKMTPEKAGRSRAEEVARISAGLYTLAKRLGMAIVPLAQIGRMAEQRADKRPQLSEIRESGDVEQDADMVCILFRPEMHKPSPENAGVAELIVAKHRSGPTGVVKLYFDKRLAHFRNLEVRETATEATT